MPTPKKGAGFGRDPAHQRLIMANMASSLFEAGYLVTTVAKAKFLRPYAEHLITKAKTGGVHQRRQVIATIHDQDVTHKLFAEIGPRYTRPSGWVPAHPQAGSAPRRQRAHGARRIGVNQLSLGEPSPAAPLRVLKLTVAYDGTDFHGFAAQPEHAHRRRCPDDRVGTRAAPRREARVRGSYRRGRARAGPGGELPRFPAGNISIPGGWSER